MAALPSLGNAPVYITDPTVPKKTMWDRIGSIFASIAKGAATVAVYSSKHPEVINTLAQVAGHPEVAMAVNAGASIVASIEDAKAAKAGQ